jgi:hypothetical protein
MLEAPPAELLMFTDPSQRGGRGLGMGAYPDRGAWLAARSDWAARHGMTIAEWSAATLEELHRRASSLDELSEAIDLIMFEEDDWQDPRDLPVQQLPPERA